MSKIKIYLLYFLFLLVYLNMGTFLIEQYEREITTIGKTTLQPIKNIMATGSSFKKFKNMPPERAKEAFIEENSTKHYFYISIWPLFFLIISGWQWVLVSLKFIFFGGLVKFILAKTGLMAVIISSTITLAAALAVKYHKRKNS